MANTPKTAAAKSRCLTSSSLFMRLVRTTEHMHLRSHQSKSLIRQWPHRKELPRGRGQIAPAGPRDEALREAHLQGVHSAVELRRREPERVLMMQLVGDAREGHREIGGRRQLEVAAAGRRRDLGQTLVGFVGLEAAPAAKSAAAKSAAPATSPASAASRSAPGSLREARTGAGEPDVVHYHVLPFGALHH